MTHPAILLAGGAVVCAVMGLTGAGGAVLTVPFLVYVVGIGTHDAVGVSLAAVGSTALLGAIRAWRRGEVEQRAALAFIGGGLAGGPLGCRLAARLDEKLLLKLFACLVILVAIRLWRHQTDPETSVTEEVSGSGDPAGEAARRPEGRLAPLVVLGVVIGILQGLFGVGGGFIIVPSLVIVVGTPIETAVGTSLTVIAVVSAGTFLSHALVEGFEHYRLTLTFAAGGVVGLTVGTALRARLPAVILQRIFAVLLLLLGLLVITR